MYPGGAAMLYSGIRCLKNNGTKKRGSMTRGSIQEYTEAVRERYLGADKKEKGKILDEFVNVTGYRRKSAIRLLYRRWKGVPLRRCGRPKKHGSYVVEALKVAWEATD